MSTSLQEVLPPALNSSSDPPSLFDGTTRLYISYICPYAQRAWITRNCKGLHDKIKLVAIELGDRPAWYKEKLYPANKVPALEYKNQVKGESLDLIKYIDSEFEGPALFPDDPAKIEFAEELFSYTDTFNKDVTTAIKENGEVGAPFDFLEKALSKFDDGPFFLGQFSQVDIAFAPFTQRYRPLLLEVKEYDITAGRPKLASWFEVRKLCLMKFLDSELEGGTLNIVLQELDKVEGYKQTKMDPSLLLGIMKKMLSFAFPLFVNGLLSMHERYVNPPPPKEERRF
ncbi:glutathione transferase [Ranunculus cassubicifolius]